jgi:ribonucleoside-diphosphate reductase alpha chain
MMSERGNTVGVDSKLDWSFVHDSVAKNGIRNGLLMAFAPTATISFIVGCSQSIEPNPTVLWVNSTLSGEFTMFNEFFVAEMKKMKAWTPELVNNLKKVDGDVSKLVLPTPIKERFKTAFNVDQMRIIEIAAARQVWVDQGISLNLYYAGESMKFMSDLYFHAWDSGLKTTYYLHTEGASKVEKSSVTSEETPSEGVCRIGAICESCQ